MAEHPELSAQERAGKAFPVSWDQFHRDCRALTWRLNEVGPFHAVIAITRGGLVPAAIVARELGVRVIDTVCIASYDHTKQGDLQGSEGHFGRHRQTRRRHRQGTADRRRSRRHRQDRPAGARHAAGCAFRHRLRQADRAGRWSTPSSPKCRRTPGSSFPGIPRCRSSRRSATARRDVSRHCGATRSIEPGISDSRSSLRIPGMTVANDRAANAAAKPRHTHRRHHRDAASRAVHRQSRHHP